MKIVLLCLISLIVSALSQNIPFKFEKPYRYYKSLIDHQPGENYLQIDVDENGPYLRATRVTSQLAPMICLSKHLVINGCQLYPFKDEIFNVIQEVFKSLPEQSYFLKKLYLLAYQILYFKLGDHNKAEEYYTKYRKFQMSDAFLIKPPSVVKEYIEQLFEYVPDSIYNFKEDNLDLVKTLGFKNEAYSILLKVYNKVLSYSLHHIDSDAEEILTSFVGSLDNLKKVVGLIISRGIGVDGNNVANLFSEDYSSNQFIEFYKLFLDPLHPDCTIIAPLADLTRNEPSSDKPVSLKVGIHKESPHICFTSTKILNRGDILTLNMHPKDVSPDGKYLEYGIYDNKTLYSSVEYVMEKNDFTDEKVSFCRSFGCAGINIEKFMEDNVDKKTFILNLLPYSLELNLLNIMRLKYMNRVDHNIHLYYFVNYKYLEFGMEIKARLNYLNLINSNKHLNLKYLYDDYVYLQNYINSYKGYNERFRDNLRTKEKLLSLALAKEHINFKQKKLIYDSIENTVRISIGKLKEKLIYS